MFETKYQKIIEQVEGINPVKYAKTRNFLDGHVTRLSPYITRGVLSLPQIRDMVLQNYGKKESEKFIQELAWREYFQKVWMAKGDEIFSDIRFGQEDAEREGVPAAVADAQTGITVLDKGIKDLYETGYMHNHMRMSVASVVANLGKYQWLQPAKWMYHHLLDGDLASNMLSWQWVAGTSISKKYTTSQSLINYWSNTHQTGTFLGFDRDDFENQPVPEVLQHVLDQILETKLPAGDEVDVRQETEILLYHPWHLDPTWREDSTGVRVLVLEPSHFEKYPVSEQVINFIITLAKENIPAIKLFVGEVAELDINDVFQKAYTKEHPAIQHFPAEFDEREWLFPQVQGYYKSFFAFWKECQKYL